MIRLRLTMVWTLSYVLARMNCIERYLDLSCPACNAPLTGSAVHHFETGLAEESTRWKCFYVSAWMHASGIIC